MKRLLPYLLLLALLLSFGEAARAYTSGDDITTELNADIADGANGKGDNAAIITLPAGVFYLSSSVNLHQSILKGAGEGMTTIEASSDFGTGVPELTGDSSGGPFQILDLTVWAPRPGSPPSGGQIPNQMDGIHLYDDCVLRRVGVLYCDRGVVIDGNHHTLDTVEAEVNYYGIAYIVSTDGSYFDDYLVDCSLGANTWSSIYIANNAKMGGCTLLRCHLGFEPFDIYLGTAAALSGCQFLQTQWEGSGNQNIADVDGTSTVDDNYFGSCSGWSIHYSGGAISGQPTSPGLDVGTFASNTIECMSAMGPLPADFTVSSAMYSNTWTIDGPTLSSIENGTEPLGTAPTAAHDNVVNAGAISCVLCPATNSILVNEPVERDGGRNQGVVPAAGHTHIFGINLAPASAGQAALIAQRGEVSVIVPISASWLPGQGLNWNGTTCTATTAPGTGEWVGWETNGSSEGLAQVDIDTPSAIASTVVLGSGSLK